MIFRITVEKKEGDATGFSQYLKGVPKLCSSSVRHGDAVGFLGAREHSLYLPTAVTPHRPNGPGR